MLRKALGVSGQFVKEVGANLKAVRSYPKGLIPVENDLNEISFAKRNEVLPIILVHGFIHNHSAFHKMKSFFEQKNKKNVLCINYKTTHGNIDKMSMELSKKLNEEICNNGFQSAFIIAHSLGGLVVRNSLERLNNINFNVQRLITIGTPHNGTRISSAVRLVSKGTLSEDLGQGSQFIEELNSSNKRYFLTSIYSCGDWIAGGRRNCKLESWGKKWANNVEFSKIGHIGLLYNYRVFEYIYDDIEKNTSKKSSTVLDSLSI